MFDNTHFYASPKTKETLGIEVGESVTHVPKANGGFTDRITKIHVAKYGLAGGCTSVCGMLSKPGLTKWAEKNVAEAAYKMACENFDRALTTRDEFVSKCIEMKDEVGKKAAEGGNVIHKEIEEDILADRFFTSSNPYTKLAAYETQKIIDKFKHYGLTYLGCHPEKSFWAEVPGVGHYGGRTDLILYFDNPDYDEPTIYVIDFKTREFEVADAIKAKAGLEKGNRTFGRLTPRDTEPMQIAANIYGHDGVLPNGDTAGGGANLYLSRTQSEAAFLLPYTEEQLEVAWGSFVACLTLFTNFKTQ